MNIRLCVAVFAIGGALCASVAGANTYTVTVSNYSFYPSSVNALVGDVVHWSDAGGTHTVTEGSPGDPTHDFDHVLPSYGATFDYTFANEGIYHYYCSFHSFLGMLGTVTVNPAVAVAGTSWGRIKALFAPAPGAGSVSRGPER